MLDYEIYETHRQTLDRLVEVLVKNPHASLRMRRIYAKGYMNITGEPELLLKIATRHPDVQELLTDCYREVLSKYNWSQTKTAEALGVRREWLNVELKRRGIRKT